MVNTLKIPSLTPLSSRTNTFATTASGTENKNDPIWIYKVDKTHRSNESKTTERTERVQSNYL